MTKFRTALLGTAAIAVAAGFAAAPAAAQDATVVQSANDKLNVSLSGHITRMSVFVDDGENSTIKHTDQSLAPSRFRINANGRVNADVSVGGVFEFGVSPGPSNAGANDQDSFGAVSPNPTTRHANVFFHHNQFGRVWLGKGSGATDGISWANTSMMNGRAYSTFNAPNASFGAARFRVNNHDQVNGANAGALRNIQANQAVRTFDGFRVNMIRYDSPTFMGTQLRAAHQDQGDWDIGLWHSATYEGFRVQGRIGFGELQNRASTTGQLSGSVSVMSPWGIAVHGGAGQFDQTGNLGNGDTGGSRTAEGWSAGVSYETQFTELGKTGIGYAYHHTYNSRAGQLANSPGAKGNTHLVSVQQNLDAVGTDLYATWARHSLNTKDRYDHNGAYIAQSGTGVEGTSFQAINVFLVGARLTF